MKKLLSLFLFSFTILIFSQKTISGKVSDEDGAVASASVTLEELSSSAIIAYGITDKAGNYKIVHQSASDKIRIKVKAFNKSTEVQEIDNKSQTLNFKLESKATEIKEVKLKTKLITKRGDTITYDLKSFESKADRSLADVLKKIPGIEVNKDGSVLYQGEPINKFYVNGKDLMEGSYGSINNSLPKDAVQKVEILENHQPVKILQDKVSSENAAINVKLKNKITTTGRGEVSSGFGDPWLWNLKLTPMLFTPKLQWVINYKTNNVGEEVEKENNIMAFGNRFEGMRRNFSENSWLNVERASIPNIPVKRYLFNNVHYVAANVLTNLSKEWELKANSSYINNAVERESFSEFVSINNTNQSTRRIFANDFYTNQAKGELIFSKNAKKGFFKNTTTYNGLWNFDKVNAENNNRFSNQTNTSPSTSFQNSLSTIIPFKEKLVNVMSFVNIRDDQQNLFLDNTNYSVVLDNLIDSNFTRQKLGMKTFETINSASLGFVKKNWTFTPEIGINFNQNKLNSDLNGETTNTIENPGVDYENKLTYKNVNPYVQMMMNYKKEGFDLNLTVPANFNNISASDVERNFERTLKKTTFNPRLFVRYDLSSFWKISGFTGIDNSFGTINDLYAGNILFNAGSLNRRNAEIAENQNKYIGSRLEYRNPLNNIFFNASYNISEFKRNLIDDFKFDPISLQTTISAIKLNNKSNNNSVRTEIGKYFPKLKSNLSLGYNWSGNVSQQLVNSNLQDVESRNQGVSVKFNNTYFSWMSVDYTASLNLRNTISPFVNKTEIWNHNLSAFFYPIQNHTIGFTWDELTSKTLDQKFKNPFFDLSYQYTLAKQKIDFEIKVLNIANTNVFEQISVNTQNNTTNISRVNIRPRQALFTVKFNFK